MCIIEDDLEDWRKESILMSTVYGNAVLNIAATPATDGNGGLFIRRDTSLLRPQIVQMPNGERYYLVDKTLYERCFNSAPLSQRAWTIQERFLAPRTVHFTSEQIFYECQQGLFCEEWPVGIPNRCSWEPGYDPEEPWSSIGSAVNTKFPKATTDLSWKRIVYQYSRARLTFGGDKPIAFSGIIHHFTAATGHDYVAGLCKHNLERQLCWARDVTESTQASSGRIPYRAPSWSWFSIDDPVGWTLYTTNNILEVDDSAPFIHIESIDVLPAGQDLLGEILYAELKLRCQPIIKSNILATPMDLLHQGPRSWSKGFHMDDSFAIETKCGLIFNERDTSILHGGVDENVFFLPVLLKSVWSLVLYGLVIIPAPGKGKGYFKRVGMFEFIFPDRKINIERLVAKLKKGKEGNDTDGYGKKGNGRDFFIAESMYQEILKTDEEEIRQYTISLI